MKTNPNSSRRALSLLSVLLATTVSTLAQSHPEVESDPMLKAMRDELKRSMERLMMQDADKPYFIEYACIESESVTIDASFGALIDSDRQHSRSVRADVRVGGYDFDNSGYFSMNDLFSGDDAPNSLVIENDYNALRHDLWLATDYAFKKSVRQIGGKRAALQNKVEDEKIPDFSREEPTVEIAARRSMQIELKRWESQIREWSAIFRAFPEIHESRVRLNAQLKHTSLMNSEGTVVRQPSMLITITATAGTQAPDGTRMNNALPIYAGSFDQLPPLSRIGESIAAMAKDLVALRAAPTLDETYSGPVLFTEQASAEMFAQLLASNLSGERPPMAEQERFASMAGSKSALADRRGRRVLSGSFSVVADPTMQAFEGQPLIGGYTVDDQGIRARRISVVENGMLKELLYSRRPSKEMARSNGHGRGSGTETPKAMVSNLIIQSAEGKSDDALKSTLIETCTAQGLKYGIMIRRLGTPGFSNDGGSSVMIIGGSGGATSERSAITAPLLAYKVYPDGREELVRGISVRDITVRSLRDIIATGSDMYVLHRVSRTGGSGMPMSIVAPPVLFEELEVKNSGATQRKPILLTHPFFEEQ